MAIDSKRKGKAGGARVITYTTLVNENTGEVWLIGYVFIDTLRRIPAPDDSMVPITPLRLVPIQRYRHIDNFLC